MGTALVVNEIDVPALERANEVEVGTERPEDAGYRRARAQPPSSVKRGQRAAEGCVGKRVQ